MVNYNQLVLPLIATSHEPSWPKCEHLICIIGKNSNTISNFWIKRNKAVYITNSVDINNVSRYYVMTNANEKTGDFLFFVLNFILSNNYYLLMTANVNWPNWDVNSYDLLSRLSTMYTIYI